MTEAMIRYNWYKAKGICVVCGQERAAKGKVRCQNCLDSAAVATMIYKSKHDASEYNRAYNKSRYEKAKAEGICVRCFQQKAREGKLTCQFCFSKAKEKQAISARLKRWREKNEDR